MVVKVRGIQAWRSPVWVLMEVMFGLECHKELGLMLNLNLGVSQKAPKPKPGS